MGYGLGRSIIKAIISLNLSSVISSLLGAVPRFTNLVQALHDPSEKVSLIDELPQKFNPHSGLFVNVD